MPEHQIAGEAGARDQQGRHPDGGELVRPFSLFTAPSAAMTSSTGSARATRQKPAAVLPTSISRNAAVVVPKISAEHDCGTDGDVVLGNVIGCRCAWGGGFSGVASVDQTLQYGGFLTHKFRELQATGDWRHNA